MDRLSVIIRIFLAIGIGGLIGYERQYSNRPAGFRTHILVCVGAAITSMTELYLVGMISSMLIAHPELLNVLKGDIGRFGAQVITGVGFIGAGTIIVHKGSVKGLTTAASLWTVACIGIAVGFGFYFLSIASALGVFGILVALKKFEDRFIHKSNSIKMKIKYHNNERFLVRLRDYFDEKSIRVDGVEFLLTEENEPKDVRTAIYMIQTPIGLDTYELLQDLTLSEEIINVRVI